jgi:membrane protease YdiL (CAAX protease family)
MYITFQDKAIFWYMFTATMLILISYSILHEKSDSQLSFISYSFFGLLSGIILFSLFWTGNYLIELFHLPFDREISALYKTFSPKSLWHYFVLFLIIIPGEELFWRGFIQKRMERLFTKPSSSIILASILYASIQIYSGAFIHFFAALIGGIFWGFLYRWKNSMPLLIVSHLVFDFLLFILFPFR